MVLKLLESQLKILSKHNHNLPRNAQAIVTHKAVATRQVERIGRQWLQKWIKNNWPKRCLAQHWKLTTRQHLRKQQPWVQPLQIILCRKKNRRLLFRTAMVQVRNNSVERAKKYTRHRLDKITNLTIKMVRVRRAKRLSGRKCKCWACRVEPQPMTAARTTWAINRDFKVSISSKWAFWVMRPSLKTSSLSSAIKHPRSSPR